MPAIAKAAPPHGVRAQVLLWRVQPTSSYFPTQTQTKTTQTSKTHTMATSRRKQTRLMVHRWGDICCKRRCGRFSERVPITLLGTAFASNSTFASASSLPSISACSSPWMPAAVPGRAGTYSCGSGSEAYSSHSITSSTGEPTKEEVENTNESETGKKQPQTQRHHLRAVYFALRRLLSQACVAASMAESPSFSQLCCYSPPSFVTRFSIMITICPSYWHYGRAPAVGIPSVDPVVTDETCRPHRPQHPTFVHQLRGHRCNSCAHPHRLHWHLARRRRCFELPAVPAEIIRHSPCTSMLVNSQVRRNIEQPHHPHIPSSTLKR
ncbi:hypothetical protein B0H12DRAFT_442755 [Mycena haematopus]|nr:hypothetical protein B0H12DRAFT_442755 [Mycena haematopus]